MADNDVIVNLIGPSPCWLNVQCQACTVLWMEGEREALYIEGWPVQLRTHLHPLVVQSRKLGGVVWYLLARETIDVSFSHGVKSRIT